MATITSNCTTCGNTPTQNIKNAAQVAQAKLKGEEPVQKKVDDQVKANFAKSGANVTKQKPIDLSQIEKSTTSGVGSISANQPKSPGGIVGSLGSFLGAVPTPSKEPQPNLVKTPEQYQEALTTVESLLLVVKGPDVVKFRKIIHQLRKKVEGAVIK